MSQTVRGRFAPSPSGRMHLGNIFCALAAWLSCRAQGGRMLLRIEDLDPDRSKPEYARQIEQDLLWLGLDWDEGGLQAPDTLQSARAPFYEQALEKLRTQGLLYPCFCTRAELHAAQAPHASDGRAVYDGRCRRLSAQQRAVLAAERAPALRLAVPDGEVAFDDLFCGRVRSVPARDCGDIIVRRRDGVHAYQLAVVVDDALMGVTEVIRGRDLLDSTPVQLCLYGLLGYAPPRFGHIPLLVAPDGRRLSKREKDLDMGALRARFGAPEPLLGRLAWACGLLPRPEPVTARDLVPLYRPQAFARGDIVIDPAGWTS